MGPTAASSEPIPAPYSPSGWLALVVDRLTGPQAKYGI